MLHVVSQSPFSHTMLHRCLDFMRTNDQLLLVQDAVIAATTNHWIQHLQDKEIYVSQEDLAARGLTAKIGIPIDMAGYVALVIKHNSPLCW
ncbi:MAG: sulfurtransferase complex subunit TusB [Tolumonas sp.]|nr:sulfurtransferase complex subunit TusB [Tolumonas sp.]MDD2841567.1 sulfurtransferase complex subunit TusB [Tolumonas sp.]